MPAGGEHGPLDANRVPEAPPPYEPSDLAAATAVAGFATPARLRLARAVRHLVDATLTSEGAPDALLDAAAERAEALAAELRDVRALPDHPDGRRRRAELGHSDYLPRSPFVGTTSPLAPPFTWVVDAGVVTARGTFHAAYEGPPGYVHGGWISLAFDEVLGMTNIVNGTPGMTGRLAVRYRKPTPLHREVTVEGRTEQVDGRRITTRGEMRVDDVLTAEAEGIFVMLEPGRAAAYFGRAPQ